MAHGKANALMLPHVMAYNAAVPTKFMPSPYTKGYVAHKKYATVADLLGLGGQTVQEKVEKLIAATEQLLDQLGSRVPLPIWAFHEMSSNVLSRKWSRRHSTIPRGARIRACH